MAAGRDPSEALGAAPLHPPARVGTGDWVRVLVWGGSHREGKETPSAKGARAEGGGHVTPDSVREREARFS